LIVDFQIIARRKDFDEARAVSKIAAVAPHLKKASPVINCLLIFTFEAGTSISNTS
jgi:hypothetical protein